jgi:hypothetical protein
VKSQVRIMVTFDLREKLIPFSLLQITNVFRGMQPGEEIEIIAGTCPVEAAIFSDVLRILPRNSYDFISQEQGAATPPVTRMKLRKKAVQPTQSNKGGATCPQTI